MRWRFSKKLMFLIHWLGCPLFIIMKHLLIHLTFHLKLSFLSSILHFLDGREKPWNMYVLFLSFLSLKACFFAMSVFAEGSKKNIFEERKFSFSNSPWKEKVKVRKNIRSKSVHNVHNVLLSTPEFHLKSKYQETCVGDFFHSASFFLRFHIYTRIHRNRMIRRKFPFAFGNENEVRSVKWVDLNVSFPSFYVLFYILYLWKKKFASTNNSCCEHAKKHGKGESICKTLHNVIQSLQKRSKSSCYPFELYLKIS